MDPGILTVSELNLVRPFVVLTTGTSSTAVTQTSKDGSAAPPTTEEVGEEDEGLQRRRSKQPVNESTGEVPLNIPPIRQIPFLSPSSKLIAC